MVRLTSKLTLNHEALARVQRVLKHAADKVPVHRLHLGLNEAEGGAPKIGVAGEGTSTLAEVARAHEFRAGRVPERSWLRTWFDYGVSIFICALKELMR